MTPTPEQEARASQAARELLKSVGFLLVSDRIEAIAIVARHLLAEREKLDGARAALERIAKPTPRRGPVRERCNICLAWLSGHAPDSGMVCVDPCPGFIARAAVAALEASKP